MLLTKNKGSGAAVTIDELKKQASEAAVAKAVEVIKNGGTQADAAAAAKLVARDVLAKGQQQIIQRAAKEKKGGLMGKLRKKSRQNKKNKAASPLPLLEQRQPISVTMSAQSSRRRLVESPAPESTTTASADDDSRIESSSSYSSTFSSSGKDSEESSRADESKTSSGADASKTSSRADESKTSKTTKSSKSSKSSKPAIYVESEGDNDDNVSAITDGNTKVSGKSKSSNATINVTDLLNVGGVMNAIDRALEEQDVRSEKRRGGIPEQSWVEKLFACDICLGSDENLSYVSSVGSGEQSILSKDAQSVLSGGNKDNANDNALDTVEEEKDHSSDKEAARGKDSEPFPFEPVPPRSGLKKKIEGSLEVKTKQSVSWLDDGSIMSGSINGATPRHSNIVSAVNPPVSSSAQPPAHGSSSRSSKDDDSSISWSLLRKPGPKKQETPQPRTTQPKEVEQQQQALEERQDSNENWRSKVTDEAPNPNPNLANRSKAPMYDPQRSNPSVFIPPTAQPPRGELINIGSPMNSQGYGYGVGSASHGLNYSPYPPPSPYRGNYGPPKPLPPSEANLGLRNMSTSMDESTCSINFRVDKYGGDEVAMISDAVARSKIQLGEAANFVYRVLSGDNQNDDDMIDSPRDDMSKTKGGGYQQEYNPYGPPPYYPPQQYQGQYSPPHQQYPPQQLYPPQHYQGQYQQQYSPPPSHHHHHHQQQQQQQYPPQQNYRQDYPPRVEPNPNSLSYYNQEQVNSPKGHRKFAA